MGGQSGGGRSGSAVCHPGRLITGLFLLEF
jgi:hypothetical protein